MTPSKANVLVPLDRTVLADLRKLEAATGEALLPRLLATFAAATPPRLAALHEALATGNSARIKQWAHLLKSSSASLGAWHMAQLCGTLELLDPTSDPLLAATTFDSITAEFESVRTALTHAIMDM